MAKCDFSKKITLWHGCSPINLLYIFRTPFYKNTSGGLLLYLGPCQISVMNFFLLFVVNYFCKKVPFRSSHHRCSVRKGVLRNFAKFTGKHLWQSLFFNKVAGLRPATLLKKRFWHRCFPVNFAKFRRASFLQNTSGQLLLSITNV